MLFSESVKHKALTLSPRYRDFVNGRDKVLEAILGKYLRAMDHVMAELRIQTERCVSHKQVVTGGLRRSDPRLEGQIDMYFALAAQRFTYLMTRMRTTAYALAHTGEAEAIARALGRPKKVHLSSTVMGQVASKDSPAGGSISGRVDLALYRLKSKVIAAVKLAQIREEKPKETVDLISRAFPKRSRDQVIPKVLRRLKTMQEAGAPKLQLITGVVDQPTWNQVLDDYREDEIPGPRGPHDKIVLFDIGSDGSVDFTERYEWELEQEITQDFVEQVRSGQIDAAKENGIEDFMWIAVVDDHTDECCTKRDGLSSAEIESELESGKLDADVCDAVVPPGHFNCRCVPAPISEDLPDTPPPDFGSFDDWMESKAAS